MGVFSFKRQKVYVKDLSRRAIFWLRHTSPRWRTTTLIVVAGTIYSIIADPSHLAGPMERW